MTTSRFFFLFTLLLHFFTGFIHAQTAARVYEFNNSFADTLGGSAMVSGGGTLGATGYTFAAGQGPNVSNALSNTGEYSIEMVFRFDAVTSYRSILNFNNRSSDYALYCNGGSSEFYFYGSGNSTAGEMVAGQNYRMIITRNATTKVTTAYVNGVQRAQVTDTNDYYVASSSGGIIHFFRDNQGEDSSGFVDQIRIYNSILTPSQVAALGNATTPSGVSATYSTGNDVPVTSAGYTASGNINFTLNYAPVIGTQLMVVRNTNLSFINGRFSNLAQGQVVTLSFGGANYRFVANYYGGTGNDLVLQWADSRIVSWGINNFGSLGNNTTTSQFTTVSINGVAVNQYTPTLVDNTGVLAGKTVVAVTTGLRHSMALCSDGTVAAWGRNDLGQLGDLTTTDRLVPVAVTTTGALSGKTVVAISAAETFS